MRSRYRPNQLVLFADEWLGQRLVFMKTATPIDGKAAAYVCEDFVCQLPTNDPAKLRELLGK